MAPRPIGQTEEGGHPVELEAIQTEEQDRSSNFKHVSESPPLSRDSWVWALDSCRRQTQCMCFAVCVWCGVVWCVCMYVVCASGGCMCVVWCGVCLFVCVCLVGVRVYVFVCVCVWCGVKGESHTFTCRFRSTPNSVILTPALL